MSLDHKLRIGHGFDSHSFCDDPARPFVLGGVTFDTDIGLLGHSDADVVVHACIDALLSPVGLGDIGTWFPDSDPEHAGANSLVMLTTVVSQVAEEGWRPVNIDCSVVAEMPRLASRRVEMEKAVSAVVRAPVSIKGKRPEGLGPVDGIACWAVALLERL